MGNLLKINDEGLNNLIGGGLEPGKSYMFIDSSRLRLYSTVINLISKIEISEKSHIDKKPVIVCVFFQNDIKLIDLNFTNRFVDNGIGIFVTTDYNSINDLEDTENVDIVGIVYFHNNSQMDQNFTMQNDGNCNIDIPVIHVCQSSPPIRVGMCENEVKNITCMKFMSDTLTYKCDYIYAINENENGIYFKCVK